MKRFTLHLLFALCCVVQLATAQSRKPNIILILADDLGTRYKLYRTGEFFDVRNDVEEKTPLRVASLKGEAATAAKLLQKALDQYQSARPAELDRIFEQAIKDRAK